MFNLSGSEILFLLLAGLVVLGPERLPNVLRQVGRLYGELRRMASGFEKEFKGTFAEPIDELRKSANELTSLVNDDFGKVDEVPSPPMSPERSQKPDVVETPISPDDVKDANQ